MQQVFDFVDCQVALVEQVQREVGVLAAEDLAQRVAHGFKRLQDIVRQGGAVRQQDVVAPVGAAARMAGGLQVGLAAFARGLRVAGRNRRHGVGNGHQVIEHQAFEHRFDVGEVAPQGLRRDLDGGREIAKGEVVPAMAGDGGLRLFQDARFAIQLARTKSRAAVTVVSLATEDPEGRSHDVYVSEYDILCQARFFVVPPQTKIAHRPGCKRVKVFCFFSSEKKAFFLERKKQRTFAFVAYAAAHQGGSPSPDD